MTFKVLQIMSKYAHTSEIAFAENINIIYLTILLSIFLTIRRLYIRIRSEGCLILN